MSKILCLIYFITNTQKLHRAVAPPSENTATVVYSHCTNRFEHLARWRHKRDVIFKQNVNDCVQHIILQKCTNFHAIQPWSFQNICNEIGWPHFLRHPVCSLKDNFLSIRIPKSFMVSTHSMGVTRSLSIKNYTYKLYQHVYQMMWPYI